ncbi:5-oxoprolinase subunit PxpB [Metabacillus sp. GX 13764]|uniref:5-oxoprolinase subunit PxpB n=1 Tax=Metabacillus kandeliae TaxID=2900151 RepID=UPI001E3C60C5|nr:5-oxoprolinase subunit PxpB [Metabacillus kandeliae]MCD7032766.1 5-oxoprolinase subunit PxpB [Metabacillus kandeliae]
MLQSNEQTFELSPLGDQAILIEFGKEMNDRIRKRILGAAEQLEKHPFPWMVEYIPSFTAIAIVYNPTCFKAGVSPYKEAEKQIRQMMLLTAPLAEDEFRTVSIPVCYGGEYGPDLDYVAEYCGKTPDEVISLHSGGEYIVHMIGFAPGFPYLGGMPESIACPRKDSPSGKIPAGSVGIAGGQTGVYPIETPGGWQIIGQTPVPLFEAEHEPPSLLKAGDRISFYPISAEEFLDRKGGKA